MSMSNYCCYEDCIDESVIVKLCPKEHAAFLLALEGDDTALETFADMHYNEGDEISEKANIAFDALKNAFDKASGLNLGMAYFHAQERSDELDGYAFVVGNVYTLTEAGNKHFDNITRKHWTMFG